MSPMQLKMLLEVFTDNAPLNLDTETRRSALTALITKELITVRPPGTYYCTERAGVFIEHLKALPLPEQVTEWRMPE